MKNKKVKTRRLVSYNRCFMNNKNFTVCVVELDFNSSVLVGTGINLKMRCTTLRHHVSSPIKNSPWKRRINLYNEHHGSHFENRSNLDQKTWSRENGARNHCGSIIIMFVVEKKFSLWPKKLSTISIIWSTFHFCDERKNFHHAYIYEHLNLRNMGKESISKIYETFIVKSQWGKGNETIHISWKYVITLLLIQSVGQQSGRNILSQE